MLTRPEVTGKSPSIAAGHPGIVNHLLSPKEVSAKTRISESTLAKWRMTGFGPAFVKMGSRVAYYEHVVDAWLASRERRSTSDAGAAR